MWTTQERCPHGPQAHQQQQKRSIDVLPKPDNLTCCLQDRIDKTETAHRYVGQPGRLAGSTAPTRHYIASTATTPGTAFMAPAICGESLKRPGSFTSTSTPSSSKMSAPSPSALSCGGRSARCSSRLATLSIGPSPRRNMRSLFENLAAA